MNQSNVWVLNQTADKNDLLNNIHIYWDGSVFACLALNLQISWMLQPESHPGLFDFVLQASFQLLSENPTVNLPLLLFSGSEPPLANVCHQKILHLYFSLHFYSLAVHWYLALCKHLKFYYSTSLCTTASNTITAYLSPYAYKHNIHA